jgi:predicted flap endonuclease-1-like 5' DNA nuclease
VVERITFHNLDNGYCVLRVQARGHRDLVTVVGNAQQVIAGEYVTATGDWVTDRTHGVQFKADEIKTNPPHTAEGITKYLGSGLVKGVGPKFATALHALGFVRFDQLAHLTATEIERLDAQLGAFSGRITRDRVVEQAAYLARNDVDGYEQTFGKL